MTNNYPQTIYNAQTLVAQSQHKLAVCKRKQVAADADIELAIATDTTLKNEQQRKAKRLELRNCDKYQAIADLARDLQLELDLAEAELYRLRNEFSILKLDRREAIARLEKEAHDVVLPIAF